MNLETLSSFFIQATPGFEDLAIRELKLKWTSLKIPIGVLDSKKKDKGGFEITMPLEQGLLLNHILKIPNRILLRLDSFKCRDFPKLFNKISKFNWRPYLRGVAPEVSASAHKSRLIHSTKIEQAVKDGIEKYYQAQPPKKSLVENPKPITLYVRLDNDLLTLSIDTSGERLHKRKRRDSPGIAPLRESIAAGLLLHTWNINKKRNLEEMTLLDPMCGSGTFLFEAASFFEVLEREYAFEYFAFLEGKKLSLPEVKSSSYQFGNLIGKDENPEIIEHNLKLLKRFPFKDKMQFMQENLFSKEQTNKTNLWAITNPPYGKRAKLEADIEEYFNAIIEKYSPVLIGIIIPQVYSKFKNKSYKCVDTFSFSNGGLAVRYEIWLRK